MFHNDNTVADVIAAEYPDLQELLADSDYDAAAVVEKIASRAKEKENLRPNYENVVTEVAEYFAGNVGSVANTEPIVRNVEPNYRIEDLDELLQYQFLRTGQPVDGPSRPDPPKVTDADAAATTAHGRSIGVRDFLSLLEDRLRTIEREMGCDRQQFHGEIRGQIDWQRTLKRRAETATQTGQTYVCRVQRRDTLASRNRVLFDLLSGFVQIAEQFERKHVGEGDSFPAWLDGWEEGGKYRTAVTDALSNPHFTQIDTSEVTADDREIRAVQRDRDPLYREAAALLERLREIRRRGATDDDADDLFGMDVFVPEESGGESTIYELYWHFELVDRFEEADGVRQLDLDSDDDLVAAWTDEESRYLLFNDWDGTATIDGEQVEYLQFAPPDARQSDGPELTTPRAGHAHQAWRRLRVETLDKEFRTECGKPDIVLLKLDVATKETIRAVFVGEVKYTDSAHTIDEGIAQLVEYGALAQVGEDGQLPDGESADEREYLTAPSDFLDDDQLELGLFVSSRHQIEAEPDEIQLCWFDGEESEPVERPFTE